MHALGCAGALPFAKQIQPLLRSMFVCARGGKGHLALTIQYLDNIKFCCVPLACRACTAPPQAQVPSLAGTNCKPLARAALRRADRTKVQWVGCTVLCVAFRRLGCVQQHRRGACTGAHAGCAAMHAGAARMCGPRMGGLPRQSAKPRPDTAHHALQNLPNYL